jgi:hypothetical protein
MTVVIVISFHESGFSKGRQLFIRLLRLTGETYGVNDVFYAGRRLYFKRGVKLTVTRDRKSQAL